jgi:hypothetical protein
MNIEQVKKKLHKEAPKFSKEIAPFYKLLQWDWCFPDGIRVPSEKDILKSIKHRINEIKTVEEEFIVESGGLRVGYRICGNLLEYVLEFVADLYSVNNVEIYSDFKGCENPVSNKKSKLSLNIITDTERNISA